MNWVETLFHVGPDDGSGLFEVAIALLVSALVALVAIRMTRRKRRAPAQEPGRPDTIR